MYELSLDNVTNVSGGANEGLGALLILGGVLTIGLLSLPSYRRTPYCRMVETPFTTVTPVYGPHGNYLGDQIDTYVTTEQVCS